MSDNNISIKNASKIVANNWDKIGERDAYEVVVLSKKPPYVVKVIFDTGEAKKYNNVKDKEFQEYCKSAT